MKPEELRIGNWILYKGTPCQLTLDDFKEAAENSQFLELFVKPIPLNEEWLLKAGFNLTVYNGYMNQYWTECTPSYYKESSEMQIAIRFGETKNIDYTVNWFHIMKSGDLHTFMHIRFVHQLQNLFHSLTGEELKLLN